MQWAWPGSGKGLYNVKPVGVDCPHPVLTPTCQEMGGAHEGRSLLQWVDHGVLKREGQWEERASHPAKTSHDPFIFLGIVIVIIFVMGETGAFLGFVISFIKEFKPSSGGTHL